MENMAKFTFQWIRWADGSASVKVFLNGELHAVHAGKINYLTKLCSRRYKG